MCFILSSGPGVTFPQKDGTIKALPNQSTPNTHHQPTDTFCLKPSNKASMRKKEEKTEHVPYTERNVLYIAIHYCHLIIALDV